MSPLEAGGVVLNIAGVWLTARRNMLCWPVGIVGVVVYAYLFWRWRLYGDMVLQMLYVVVQLYGWYTWRRATKDQPAAVVPVRAKGLRVLAEVGATGALSALLAWLMARYTDDAMPRIDALLTGFSLLASWWAARLHRENWILWVIVDTAYTVLFVYRGDDLTAFLYGTFTLLALYGAAAWRSAVLGAPGAEAPRSPR
ncbi:nicotinamide mononucleotide transporter [Ameyamaea chiangmaiensis NBRC 103196]|uniref:Nicotinamide riboside transporter PnuC n=1 Tax=Ameyamaea chiangmaiensis TaxID=442969 RepID=A0A850PCL3_9PROT|nr:nicotinamide riboside transporter PnuC [Ameyamaea chiangmaiensis]MBS4075565.1 nicotinamide riboside transporter PnuC [Ameyamaea chiangmaiensis]NVN40250.1 nicotinamide mononucleotide transporter [Ameyamaea chiangmaiensis]GBQ69302.1 nicotinamide mononucleotide transporter [Ameyamaea chiangmaiensis NBRC 103196]